MDFAKYLNKLKDVLFCISSIFKISIPLKTDKKPHGESHLLKCTKNPLGESERWPMVIYFSFAFLPKGLKKGKCAS